jgi:urease accessory protein
MTAVRRPARRSARLEVQRPASVGRRRVDADAPLTTTALLQLIRLASPSLPVGGFSYSEGIESAVDAALVRDEASARAWLLDQLELGIGRSELPVAARALAAWRRGDHDTVAAWNAWFSATRETSELRRQAEQMGRSLALWLRQRDASDARVAVLDALAPAPTWPLAFALAAADSGASPRAVLASLAAGWAENATQAALKAVPLGQAAAQRILAALAAAIPATVDRALRMPATEMQAFAPMLAILSARHEEQYSRLFRS